MGELNMNQKITKDLVIIGASGFGREVANLVEVINKQQPTWNLLGLIDDNLTEESVEKFKIIGNLNDLMNMKIKPYVVVAIADAKIRKMLVSRLEAQGFKFATLIDPSARIGHEVTVGEGTVYALKHILQLISA